MRVRPGLETVCMSRTLRPRVVRDGGLTNLVVFTSPRDVKTTKVGTSDRQGGGLDAALRARDRVGVVELEHAGVLDMGEAPQRDVGPAVVARRVRSGGVLA